MWAKMTTMENVHKQCVKDGLRPAHNISKIGRNFCAKPETQLSSIHDLKSVVGGKNHWLRISKI